MAAIDVAEDWQFILQAIQTYCISLICHIKEIGYSGLTDLSPIGSHPHLIAVVCPHRPAAVDGC